MTQSREMQSIGSDVFFGRSVGSCLSETQARAAEERWLACGRYRAGPAFIIEFNESQPTMWGARARLLFPALL